MIKRLSKYEETERVLDYLNERICEKCPNRLMALVTNKHQRPCMQSACRRHELPNGRFRYRIKCTVQTDNIANHNKTIKWSFITDEPITYKEEKRK